MKIKLNNTSFPKPLLSSLTDDFNDNLFNIKIVEQQYDKENQKLDIKIKTTITNKFIEKLVSEKKVYIILHLEQMTQRELSVINISEITTKKIDLYKYSTTEPIEVIGVLYCAETFEITDKSIFNNIYSLLDKTITYERGDILGYSNDIDIKLPEDKRIGSIFNVVRDTDNILGTQPFNVSLNNSQLIQILVNSDIHEKFVTIYKKDQYVKKLMFFSIVEPALITAYTEMFLSYESYKDKKWCRTLTNKVENKLKLPAEEIFTLDKYDIEKVYEYTNIALGSLFKDSVETYESGMEA